MTEDLCEIVVTAPNHDWLVDLCAELVELRHPSSAHVVHPVTSIYPWKGEVLKATESRAFLRSRTALVEALTAYVAERHPYEVPNISALPLIGGNPAYLSWIRAETAGATQHPRDRE
jgi:periplasmic divalent cation tolerance protein